MGKLVRDKIPEIIKSTGKTPITKILKGRDYLDALCDKLIEEAKEFNIDRSVKELADVLEVVKAIMSTGSYETVYEEMDHKRDLRGGFEKGIYLEGVANVKPILKETKTSTDIFDIGYEAGWNDCIKMLSGQEPKP